MPTVFQRSFPEGVYGGEFKYGKKHGKGKMLYNDGRVYEGDWKGNKKNGKGKYSHPEGAVYEGDWLDGKKHGKGRNIRSNGDVMKDNSKVIRSTVRGNTRILAGTSSKEI